MTINNKYHIGQTVYLITDDQQLPRMVIGIKVCAKFGMLYYLACGEKETIHAEIEVSSDKTLHL